MAGSQRWIFLAAFVVVLTLPEATGAPKKTLEKTVSEYVKRVAAIEKCKLLDCKREKTPREVPVELSRRASSLWQLEKKVKNLESRVATLENCISCTALDTRGKKSYKARRETLQRKLIKLNKRITHLEECNPCKSSGGHANNFQPEGVTEPTIQETTEVTTKATTQVTTPETTEATTKATTQVTTPETTEATTQATTPETTEATTKATTPETTEATTKATTQVTTPETTEATTQATTQVTTPETTEATTPETTEATTHATTQVTTPETTEATTQATTQVTTPETTEATTEAATQVTTPETIEATTQATTQPTTKATTQATTQVTTQETTEATTQAATEVTTPETTEATTQLTTQETTKATATQATTQEPTTVPSTEPTNANCTEFIYGGNVTKNLSALSLCLWVKHAGIQDGSFEAYVSYAVPLRPFMMTFGYIGGYLEVTLFGKRGRVKADIRNDQWYHICLVWDSRDAAFKVFMNGDFLGRQKSTGRSLQPNGLLYFGQHRAVLNQGFTPSMCFRGDMACMNLWDYTLSSLKIKSMGRSCRSKGNLVSSDDVEARSLKSSRF